MKNILTTLKVLLIASFISINTASSHASKNAVRIFIKHQAQFQQGDFSALENVTLNTLRNVKDDKKGTLYYGALLLYFNGHQKKAETALRLVARTKDTLWRREAIRLVVYFMMRSARYNHVKPFLENVLKNDEIRQDIELFYYYSFALFLTREYETLTHLLQGTEKTEATKPKWNKTLRKRVAEQNALFSYDFWNALMKIRTNAKKNSDLLYKTLLSHNAEAMMDSVSIFIKRIYSETGTSIPMHINTVLKAKQALQLQSENAQEMFLSLDTNIFIHSGMIEDLLSIARNNKKHTWRILRILNKARKHEITPIQKSYIDSARAYLYYERKTYKNSHEIYKSTFADINTYQTLSRNIQNQDLWRMLLSVIQTDWRSFIKTFDKVISYTNNPKYFANALEEYLSILLQKKQYTQLQKDFVYLSKKYSENSIMAELNRWYFILKRINTYAKINSSIQNVANTTDIFHRRWSYTSAAPFEYLLSTNNVTKNQFLRYWTIDEENTNSSHLINEMQKVVISEALFEGYFSYGLYNYAYEIVSRNITKVSIHTVRKMARYLFYQIQDYSRAFMLAQKFAAKSLLFPQTEEDFFFLYPNAVFSKYIKSVTKKPTEQAMLYALMREESSFIPTITSDAGAIGLMQLLPETAQDIASRISYDTFNLKNPKDNIVLGYNYFKYLLRVFKKPAYVSIAYNGGFGNFRKWKNTFNVSDSIVFVDSLPFRETRNYTRKVVSSALVYALLYYNIPSNVMIQYLFQNSQ